MVTDAKAIGAAAQAVKGVTLAQRYYGTLSARACRDLDLLVDPKACPATIAWMLDNGFRLVGSLSVSGEGAERARPEGMVGLEAVLRTRGVAQPLAHDALPVPGVGRPRWLVELIRSQAGQCADFIVEACDEKGRLALPADLANRSLVSDPQRRAS